MKTMMAVVFCLVVFVIPCFAGQREIVGRWYDPPIRMTVEIYKENSRFYIVRGSSVEELIKEKSARGGKAAFLKRDSNHGDRYVITKDNYLEMWDKMGLIDTIAPEK